MKPKNLGKKFQVKSLVSNNLKGGYEKKLIR